MKMHSRSTVALLTVLQAALLMACDAPAPLETAPLLAPHGPELARGAEPRGLVRSTWPSADDPGAPFYARIEPAPPFVHADGGWAVIPFYRDPDCLLAVRPDFNLLHFFDAPAAFACPMTVHGHSLWHGGVGMGAPHTVISHGTGAVPVWFVPESVIGQAMADGDLTIVELAALPGLRVGHASHFNEMLHPHSLPPALGGGGHPVPKLVLNARGTLEDGGAFSVHLTVVADETRSIQIRLP
jgi:hypothetical protein